MNILEFISMPQVIVSLAVLIILMWRIAYGYKYGFVAELIEIAGLATGFVIFSLSAGAIGKLIHGENLHILKTIIQLAIVITIYRVIQGIANGTKGTKKIPVLTNTNKVMGAAFGAVETYMWVMLIQHIVGYKIDDAISFTISKLISCIPV
ncbi:CvpA family protein [Butyrivibrio sp. INlla16]|uniref:CvpA family protein n=1 Tax=Butyrivibrio sp. INlla16 TaxID=1520807 RepID=UPI00087E7647|nr:CvpA family protein [Butyrivibrio sp. INlla16]SDB18764.1 Colicin V production protein [Butyrivibrio sp. INlla16]